jgi:hypothetical protein
VAIRRTLLACAGRLFRGDARLIERLLAIWRKWLGGAATARLVALRMALAIVRAGVTIGGDLLPHLKKPRTVDDLCVLAALCDGGQGIAHTGEVVNTLLTAIGRGDAVVYEGDSESLLLRRAAHHLASSWLQVATYTLTPEAVSASLRELQLLKSSEQTPTAEAIVRNLSTSVLHGEQPSKTAADLLASVLEIQRHKRKAAATSPHWEASALKLVASLAVALPDAREMLEPAVLVTLEVRDDASRTMAAQVREILEAQHGKDEVRAVVEGLPVDRSVVRRKRRRVA